MEFHFLVRLVVMFSMGFVWYITIAAAKTNLYECGMGEPLFVYSPRGKKAGVHSQLMASSLDLVPTVLDWSGIKYPSYKLNGMHV